MKNLIPLYFRILIILGCIIIAHCETSLGQEYSHEIITFEDYTGEFIDELDPYLTSLEEWQEMIDQWLEKPLCINNEEADWLAEYKIISLFQLNKLKEYRMIYGDLLSEYELYFIEGWDHQTCRKTSPLITIDMRTINPNYKRFNFHTFRHCLVMKSGFSTSEGKGYQVTENDQGLSSKHYTGSPVRLSIRYDLEFKDKIIFGIRMEKDPGEPFLVGDSSKSKLIKAPDMTAAYLQINNLGLVKSVILGNYRISFGYGLNISGGMTGIKSRNGMAGMAGRTTPQTSVSETGFWRGAAISSEVGRISITGFASNRNLDGTSLELDTLTGNVISFSSISQSGLHRSASELSGRKSINETMLGGFIVFRNQWLKTGAIAMYNHFNARINEIKPGYDKFGLTGKENLVGGLSVTAWIPKIQFISELSICRNKSHAILSGLQVTPVPGALISFVYRNFSAGYQNWNGSGYISASRNASESGIRVNFRLELPKKYLLEVLYDQSRNSWITYDLEAPSKRYEIGLIAEKAWASSHSINFSFRRIHAALEDKLNSGWICHPFYRSQYKIRLEHRIETIDKVQLKSRVECSTGDMTQMGWLILQDFGVTVDRLKAKLWLRVCFFDAKQYENSIYAYENDVQYDFTSFMHYGKGLRGVIMIRQNPVKWMDIWFRYSTIYYSNKQVGTGWDETGNNRQNEFEIQIRIKLPD